MEESTYGRTCVGCGGALGPSDGLRWFLGHDGTPWPDWTGRAARHGGRGAHTHRRASCVTKAFERRGFSRPFRAEVGRISASDGLRRYAEAGRRALMDRLGLANRAGVLSVGQVATDVLVREGRVGAVFVSEDAGSAARGKYGSLASHRGVPRIGMASGEALGIALGREFVSVVTVAPSRFSRDLIEWATSLAGVSGSGVSSVEGVEPLRATAPVEEVEGREIPGPETGTVRGDCG